MIRKFLLPGLAILGALVALAVVFWTQKVSPSPAIPFQPPRSPFEHTIYGEGIIESSSLNISIGSPFSEIVMEVFVIEGDMVKAGDPLFQLDTRLLEAQAETVREQIRYAVIHYENLKTQFSFFENLKDKRAVSQQQYEQAFYAMKEAEEQISIAKAQLGEVETNIERSLVTAPIDGEILQVNIHVGEVAPNVPTASSQLIIPYASSQFPLMLMGSVEPLQLRIDIDEVDAWRYQKGAQAIAYVRGNRKMHFPLKFLRIEPYIIPKASFTGQTTERIDTRVFQVLYRFDKHNLPIYPGQLLDVYFKVSPPKEEAK